MRRRRLRGILIALGVLLFVFAAALSSDVSAITTPSTFAHPFVARKLLSIIAFACAGAALCTALPKRYLLITVPLAVAGLSLLIEVAQYFDGSSEGLRSNLIDVGCGAIGGFAGVFLYLMFKRTTSLRARV